MGAYNKLFAAVVATLASRWILKYLGFDIQSTGLGPFLDEAISYSLDVAVAAFVGFWVYLVPNIKRRVDAWFEDDDE